MRVVVRPLPCLLGKGRTSANRGKNTTRALWQVKDVSVSDRYRFPFRLIQVKNSMFQVITPPVRAQKTSGERERTPKPGGSLGRCIAARSIAMRNCAFPLLPESGRRVRRPRKR